MRKILLTGVAVMSVITINSANAENILDRTFTGPYAGVYGGYGWTDADNQNGADPSPDGGDYGIYAGFMADTLLDSTINKTGLGLTGAIELHYGWSDADDTVGGVNVEKNDEFGVSFKPGMAFLNNDYIVDVNPYGIIGYRRTEFEATSAGVSNKEDYDGFELGIGTKIMAWDHIGVRLDYTHVWYGEENGIDPDEDNIRLGVGYNF